MKLKKLLSIAALSMLVLFIVSCSNNADQTSNKFDITSYKNNDFLITADELKKKLGNDDLVLIDCNNPDIYKKEHIKGAISIGLHGFSDTVGKPGDPGWGTIKNKEELTKTLKTLGIDNKKTIVFYSNVFKGP